MVLGERQCAVRIREQEEITALQYDRVLEGRRNRRFGMFRLGRYMMSVGAGFAECRQIRV